MGSNQCGSDVYKEYLFLDVLPSSAGDEYDATSSAGSNKATDQEYLDEVKAHIDTFLVHHPYLNRADVPAEMDFDQWFGTGS